MNDGFEVSNAKKHTFSVIKASSSFSSVNWHCPNAKKFLFIGGNRIFQKNICRNM